MIPGNRPSYVVGRLVESADLATAPAMVRISWATLMVEMMDYNSCRSMKKCLFIAAALLAAVACSREPIIPEEPIDVIVEENGPIQVTLVAVNPETRTELGVDDNLVKPFWSYGDNICVVKVPNVDPDAGIDENFEVDENDEDSRFIYHGFTGNVTETQQRSLSASFSGSVTAPGQYRAFYPEHTEEVVTEECEWDGETWTETYIKESGPCLKWDDSDQPSISFSIPWIQHPTSTSFDPTADLLVSNPFNIETAGSQTLGSNTQNSEIPINFTRVNAIVKVVFNPTGELRTLLQGEKVKRVSFNTMGSGSMGDAEGMGMYNSPTRAEIVDNFDNQIGLTGDMVYSFPYFHDSDLASFDVNEYDYYSSDGWAREFVVAEYTDDTAYEILSQDDETATYFMVFPSILQNYYDYYDGTFYEGLPIRVETDKYVITRDIKLPDTGIALQPSVVTTIKINLKLDNVDIEQKEITLSKSETTLIPGDGEFVDLVANEITFPKKIKSNAEFQQYFTVTAPQGISLSYVDATDVGYEGDRISDLYLSVDDENMDPDDYDVTITYEGYTTTCTVHVITLSESDIMDFDDDAVKAICVGAWGHYFDDEITYYEASKVKSFENPNNGFKSYFYNNKDIESFKELQYFTGLREIGYQAFYGCENLHTVIIPEGVTMIESTGGNSYAFQGCTSLKYVTLPSTLEIIGFKAFYGCESLEVIALPANVKTISGDAFRGCINLTTVSIPSDSHLETIYGSFYQSNSEYGAHGAFYGCSSLASIWLPPTLKTIGDYAFKDCSALTSINLPEGSNVPGIYLPEGLRDLSSYAFSNCTSITKVIIPGSVATIGEDAFHGCTSLSEVILNEGLETIGRRAFFGCGGLHQIVFPASLTALGFWNGEGLVFYGVEFRSGTDGDNNEYQGVKFLGSNPPNFQRDDITISGKHWEATANDGAGGWVNGVTVYVPTGSKDAYLAVGKINPGVTDRESYFVEY